MHQLFYGKESAKCLLSQRRSLIKVFSNRIFVLKLTSRLCEDFGGLSASTSSEKAGETRHGINMVLISCQTLSLFYSILVTFSSSSEGKVKLDGVDGDSSMMPSNITQVRGAHARSFKSSVCRCGASPSSA